VRQEFGGADEGLVDQHVGLLLGEPLLLRRRDERLGEIEDVRGAFQPESISPSASAPPMNPPPTIAKRATTASLRRPLSAP
jgi:hypothetical protein